MRAFGPLLTMIACAVATTGRAAVDSSVLQAEADRVAVLAKASAAAVAIFAPGGGGGGSGVVITRDGYALSNFHVTNGAGDAMKCGMADGRVYDAVIVGIDPVGDVALVKLLGRDDFPHAEMADSDLVQLGDGAFAVGNPFLLANDFTPSVSYGIISGVHRYQYPAGTLLEYTDCLQTDASINPGNSGGPLFDAQGRLIGINGRGSFEKRGRVNVGVGYAISINQIKNFLGHLKGGRIVDHATLGARVATRPDGVVAVNDILEDSDAFRRGLRHGDELVRFAGRPIRTVNAYKNVLGIFPKDWRVPLAYRRDGKTNDIAVRLEGLHSPEELLAKLAGRVPAEPDPDRKAPDRPAPGQPGRDPKKPNPDDDAPDGQQPPPRPRSAPHTAKAAPMPDQIKAVFEKKRGYANYYFNKVERARTWNRCVARGDLHEATGEWLLKGEVAAGGDAELRLSDSLVTCIMPGTAAEGLRAAIGDDLTAQADPPGSGGLLAALSLWRRLLVLGPENFGDVAYLGTVPLVDTQDILDRRAIMLLGHDHAAPADKDSLCDALIATYAGVECRFVFDAKTGNLAVLEMFRSTLDDPCELHFSDYAEIEGRVFPRHIECRYGDAVFATFRLHDVKLERGGTP